MIHRTACTLNYQGPLDSFDEHLTALYEALLDLEGPGGPRDVDAVANLALGTAEIEMLVEAESQMDAIACTITYFRTALHALGVPTPGWERMVRNVRLQDAEQDDDDLQPA